MDEFKSDQLTQIDLQFDSESKTSLFNMGKWAKFLSVTIFIFLGLFLIILVIAGTAFRTILSNYIPGLGEMGSAVLLAITLFMLLLLAFYASVFYFLYNFSTKIKQGLLTEDTNTINKGLKSLKTYFIISTILATLAMLINFLSTILS